MEKRILVAVDDSTYSRKAIEYAAQMKGVITDLSFIIFNVQPTISDYLLHDSKRDAKATAALKEVIAKNEKTSKQLLENYKSKMIKKGVDEKSIDLVTQPRAMGTAKDILLYAKHQLPDAIVLGRRGTSRLEEAFIGSVANTVLEHAGVVPIWAIDGKITSSKIMVAIDGSESSLNAVDHISFMVGDNPDVKLVLLHVTPTLRDYCTIDFDKESEIVDEVIARGDKQCVDDFYTHAQQRFKAAGINENQISIKEVKSTINVGKTIVDEAKKGKYGIIVVGRKGMNDSFFMGSVSRYVVNKASNCAVWLVP
ncbi:MAG: universal stress protein [Deltaproteobacteria bacterium]|nr:universal stress protein [Deltaproteobacteria bacterium]MBW1909873.1 universal stress protein [Deltaproteobacteria bacterium]MBW2033271.1 universal stress protein [Deltaproteobacteria bacterium]MBW2113855.1 universal stress protein [Deltaproteobacteria bacterium]MBW2358093.1 universal stress protein [Deltaproteobacteria bacterium]